MLLGVLPLGLFHVELEQFLHTFPSQ